MGGSRDGLALPARVAVPAEPDAAAGRPCACGHGGGRGKPGAFRLRRPEPISGSISDKRRRRDVCRIADILKPSVRKGLTATARWVSFGPRGSTDRHFRSPSHPSERRHESTRVQSGALGRQSGLEQRQLLLRAFRQPPQVRLPFRRPAAPAHRVQYADAAPSMTDGAQTERPGRRPMLAMQAYGVGHIHQGRKKEGLATCTNTTHLLRIIKTGNDGLSAPMCAAWTAEENDTSPKRERGISSKSLARALGW